MENEPETWIELATLTRNVIEFLRIKTPAAPELDVAAGVALGEDTNPDATELRMPIMRNIR